MLHMVHPEAIGGTDREGQAILSPGRLRGAAVAAPCLLALILTGRVAPRADGFGTHEDLGLPACSVLAETGWPCPTCGLTTSVSAMAHGRVGTAIRAHPFGPVAFALLLAFAAAGMSELAAGVEALGLLRPRLWWIAAALAGILAGWAIKLVAGALTGELPIR
jgi:hypothetical protein